MNEPQAIQGFVPRMGAVIEIIDAVAQVYAITSADILGAVRSKSLVEARQCVYIVARLCTRLSYPEIARAVHRDHTTVISGVKRAELMRSRDPWLRATVAELLERFGGEIEKAVTQ